MSYACVDLLDVKEVTNINYLTDFMVKTYIIQKSILIDQTNHIVKKPSKPKPKPKKTTTTTPVQPLSSRVTNFFLVL